MRRIVISLSPEVYEALKKAADAERRLVSDQAAVMLERLFA